MEGSVTAVLYGSYHVGSTQLAKEQVMDDSRKGGSKRVIALVVRQFAPSRIEQQLLAQVFDLVCYDRQKLTNSSTERQADHQPAGQIDRGWSMAPQLAKRATS